MSVGQNLGEKFCNPGDLTQNFSFLVISSETSVSVEVIKADSTQQFVSSDSTQHHQTVVHTKNGHFDPMYPSFTSQQVEYSSSPKHLEPFYRYRVYSDSSYC